jgi:hypothetical protein
VQVPLASHVSAPLHALPSPHDVPVETGVCCTPVAGLHESVVHGLLSLTVGAAPGVHVPDALHVSAPLHALPSVHDVPAATGVCVTPPEGVHASVVHGLLSSIATAPVPVQAPVWQVSVDVHALLSLHDAPSGLVGFEQLPVAVSQVPATWHWSCAVHTTGFPPLHAPL